ncbi:MAG: virulence RhuM family protein [Candidatus Thiodubiliella endoseptemdiera]|uniref:Virulence RhuM family protein n=1 Tax=Candidatus Thiodubiliella endoseptemdiera TaxID=2738886 RepID=A0A853F409_9GAMM|nr:virulence RhuM family protein [Candidatus Thiodubiliella endoseptemdiera]
MSEKNTSQFIIYQSEDGKIRLDVRFMEQTVWLTQALMAQLFNTTPENILMHLKNIYNEGELNQIATTKDFLVVRKEGDRAVKRHLQHYNLDAIISVGYRVQSHSATRFRQWATGQLKEFIIKGFVLDDERLKNPDLPFDYFEELTKRIQDIRTSEARFYRKITDIYATSVDYDANLELSINFFKTVQNKIHWAITGQTAAEIITSRVDSDKHNMGLTNWRGVKVRKQDVAIAKNYLNEDEIEVLNNLTEQYLIFAEGQAMRRIPMTMADWIKKLEGFLTLNDRDILDNAGKVSNALAKQIAQNEYTKFHQKRLKNSINDDKNLEDLSNKVVKNYKEEKQ